jgi:general secretion pathway protein N
VVEVTIPPAAPANAPTEQRPLSANPLWGMPVKQFSVTRERPIFLPSRRQPAPPPSTETVAKVVAPPKPKEPERPQLSLVGTIAGDEDRFGILVDQASKAVLRLREGDDFQGWTLESVKSREVTFQKNQQSFVVALPQPAIAQSTLVVREEVASTPFNTRQRPSLK